MRVPFFEKKMNSHKARIYGLFTLLVPVFTCSTFFLKGGYRKISLLITSLGRIGNVHKMPIKQYVCGFPHTKSSVGVGKLGKIWGDFYAIFTLFLIIGENLKIKNLVFSSDLTTLPNVYNIKLGRNTCVLIYVRV